MKRGSAFALVLCTAGAAERRLDRRRVSSFVVVAAAVASLVAFAVGGPLLESSKHGKVPECDILLAQIQRSHAFQGNAQSTTLSHFHCQGGGVVVPRFPNMID